MKNFRLMYKLVSTEELKKFKGLDIEQKRG